MPTFSVKDIIGKHLVAKKQLTAFYGQPNSKNIFIVFKGNDAGLVDSWVTREGNQVWWQFIDGGLFGKGAYYIKHDPSAFDYTALTDQGVQSEGEKATEAAEAKKKEDMGAFAYYAQKWGGTILGVSAVVVIAATAIKSYGNKK